MKLPADADCPDVSHSRQAKVKTIIIDEWN